MSLPFNPDSIGDYVTLLGIATLTYALPAWFANRVRNHGKQIHEIKEQVCNNHDENLRDEITRGFKEIRDDLRLIRDELHTERKERIEGDEEIRRAA